jgi:hypothetical protein
MIALLGLLMAKDLINYPAEIAEFQEKKIKKSVIGRRASMAKTIHIIGGNYSGSLRSSSLVTCPRDASVAPPLVAGAPAWTETSFLGGVKRLPVRYSVR